LRTSPDFEVTRLSGLFDSATWSRIREVAATLAPQQLELHEAHNFKRFVVHDHPFFTELQARVVDRVSEAAGEAVEPCYNFLSLYGPKGVCPLHMDAPFAKWTLDVCIAQSIEWPIHFSRVIPWPEPRDYGANWESQIRSEIATGFSTWILEPEDALLFAGSSQWHWRDPMPSRATPGFCDLLFFHFIPRGMGELVNPGNWARLFAVPELATLRGVASFQGGGSAPA
jgi:hypothetical protein